MKELRVETKKSRLHAMAAVVGLTGAVIMALSLQPGAADMTRPKPAHRARHDQ